MKILVVGAGGDIGKAASEALADRHEIITAGRSSGDIRVDLSVPASVSAMFAKVGPLNAVVSMAGDAHFAALSEHSMETFMVGLTQKVMGQVNLFLQGMDHLVDGRSFTLTSGVLDRDPIAMSSNTAAANGALGGFVKAAALEMPRGQRINAVSPEVLEVSMPRYGECFRGHKPVSSEDVGRAYIKCVEGSINGQVVVVE